MGSADWAVQAAEGARTATNPEPESRTATHPEQEIQQLQRYFFAAARTGELVVLTEFLTAGYPVNERNEQSYTALMIAAYAGQATAVDVLLHAGADACLRDKRGHTALMGAMIKAEWDIARTLYDIDCDQENSAKATDEVTDKAQMTAAQFAQVFGQSEKFKAMVEAKNLKTLQAGF
ncbi:ankyrin repeat domain-containing protein [Rheinheimera riviphila]|uniref:Ankyrin repeat domain-containing protein n=2 Tax=Rheinheimera riviphila TaxID=1834037 RepID=A0A437QFP6_9GAMM|nr:ankyrin repeat domain-containing protein [Rheinheimera riviphila]